MRAEPCLAINPDTQQAIAFSQRAAHGVHARLVVCGVNFRLLNGATLNMFYSPGDLHRRIVGGSWDSYGMNPWILDVIDLLQTTPVVPIESMNPAEPPAPPSGDSSKVYANIVSTLAFLLAIASLYWQYHRSRLDSPSLTVSGQPSVTWDSEQPTKHHWSLPVHLANTGHRTASIKDIGWQLQRADGGVVNVKAGPPEPAVPMKLEALDSQDWELLIEIKGTIWDGRQGRPYATVVARPTRSETKKGIGAERTLTGPWSTLHDYSEDLPEVPS